MMSSYEEELWRVFWESHEHLPFWHARTMQRHARDAFGAAQPPVEFSAASAVAFRVARTLGALDEGSRSAHLVTVAQSITKMNTLVFAVGADLETMVVRGSIDVLGAVASVNAGLDGIGASAAPHYAGPTRMLCCIGPGVRHLQRMRAAAVEHLFKVFGKCSCWFDTHSDVRMYVKFEHDEVAVANAAAALMALQPWLCHSFATLLFMVEDRNLERSRPSVVKVEQGHPAAPPTQGFRLPARRSTAT